MKDLVVGLICTTVPLIVLISAVCGFLNMIEDLVAAPSALAALGSIVVTLCSIFLLVGWALATHEIGRAVRTPRPPRRMWR